MATSETASVPDQKVDPKTTEQHIFHACAFVVAEDEDDDDMSDSDGSSMAEEEEGEDEDGGPGLIGYDGQVRVLVVTLS